jgi:hypothetical protein
MGEYARDQMARDFKRMTGTDAGDLFEEDDAPRHLNPKLRCPKCGKVLRSERAARDHLRDKHGDTNAR